MSMFLRNLSLIVGSIGALFAMLSVQVRWRYGHIKTIDLAPTQACRALTPESLVAIERDLLVVGGLRCLAICVLFALLISSRRGPAIAAGLRIALAFVLFHAIAGATFDFAEAYARIGIVGQTAAIHVDFIYFSAITMATVGYGDFVSCPNARILAAIHGFVGVISIPLLLSLLLPYGGDSSDEA
jgi:hypothetical protein